MAQEIQVKQNSAELIKVAAMTLMAQRGADGVSVRDIAEAAGQKNAASIGYYFGSKEQLIREIVIDCADRIDERRNNELDALEAEGTLPTIEKIVDILIYTAVGLSHPDHPESENRFLLLLSLTHQDFFHSIVEDKRNKGYQRCLTHLRRLMADIPAKTCNERFIFMNAYLGAVLSAREARLSDNTQRHRMWSQKKTLQHVARTTCALLRTEHP